MKTLQKQFLQTIKIVVLGLIVGLGANYAFAISWTPPTQAPTGGNTFSPLNVGDITQIKQAGLTLGYGYSSASTQAALYIANGRLGIGTLNPTQKLEVSNGNIAASGYCLPGSLPTGGCITAWPTGGGSGSVGPGTSGKVAKFNSTGNNVVDSKIYDNGTNIGIGTTNPQRTLDIQGRVRITGAGGNVPADGRVLTAVNAQGDAEWKSLGTGTTGAGTCHWVQIPTPNENPAQNIDVQCSANEVMTGVKTIDYDAGGGPNVFRGVQAIKCCSLSAQ